MQLDQWLLNLAECLRDDIPPEVVAEWVKILRSWRELTDDEWQEAKLQIIRCHRSGPLRFPEIQDAVRDVLEEAERKRNSEHIAKLRTDLKAG